MFRVIWYFLLGAFCAINEHLAHERENPAERLEWFKKRQNAEDLYRRTKWEWNPIKWFL